MFGPGVWGYSESPYLEGRAVGQVLHGCATTTEAVRRAIHARQASVRWLAAHHGVNSKTVQKWRHGERPTCQCTWTKISRSHSSSGARPVTVTASARAEGRDRPRADAARAEGDAQCVLEVVVPPQRALPGVVGVDDDLHEDAVLTRRIRCARGHPASLWPRCPPRAADAASPWAGGRGPPVRGSRSPDRAGQRGRTRSRRRATAAYLAARRRTRTTPPTPTSPIAASARVPGSGTVVGIATKPRAPSAVA